MKIVLTYSSKNGLKREYRQRLGSSAAAKAPEDCFAEGDSLNTINTVMDAIRSLGNEVYGVEADGSAMAKLRKIKPDMVFNIAEGLFGDFRESYIPMICERLGIRYTGSGPLTLGICLHKGRCKEVLSAYDIPNADFKVFYPGDKLEFGSFKFPGIVKPVAEGSSKGIFDNSVVEDAKQAKALIQKNFDAYNQAVILESFLEGDEFTVAMIGNGDELEILPLVGLDFSQLPSNARKIYSYEAKWIWDTKKKPLKIFNCPAPVSASLKKQIESVVRRSFRALDIKDWCRMDVRLDSAGIPHVIEVNPLPGILPDPDDNSCFPKAARVAGYSYPELFRRILISAERRFSQVPNGHR